jgi:hypothetical protein
MNTQSLFKEFSKFHSTSQMVSSKKIAQSNFKAGRFQTGTAKILIYFSPLANPNLNNSTFTP